MKYANVGLASAGFAFPSEIVPTEDLERQLQPLYERLKLPAGRLELMTGIRERRFYPRSTRPGEISVQSARNALAASGFDAEKIGCLIHASVCRDHLEPATACSVHHHLGLDSACSVYDVSNACLGILNGVVQIANMIELGQIEAGLVVGSESGRGLVETTIEALNRDLSLTRQSIKDSVASLTIGSASCAIVVANLELCAGKTRLVGGAVRANSKWNELCRSEEDLAGGSFQPLMKTDSHELMVRGVETGVETFGEFLANTGWTLKCIDRTVCHQVGVAHQKMMLESLGLDPENDHTTFSWLGNTGSAALPITLADAVEKRVIQSGHRTALLGIGSGINCVMLGLECGELPVNGSVFVER